MNPSLVLPLPLSWNCVTSSIVSPCLRAAWSLAESESPNRQERIMRDRTRLQTHQRPLPFSRLDLWEQFPETIRQECQKLYVQLLQTVMESETVSRREYERED